MLVDSHCHIDFNDFEGDIDEIIQHMKENGVTAVLNAGNGLDGFDGQLDLSEKYPFIYTLPVELFLSSSNCLSCLASTFLHKTLSPFSKNVCIRFASIGKTPKA